MIAHVFILSNFICHKIGKSSRNIKVFYCSKKERNVFDAKTELGIRALTNFDQVFEILREAFIRKPFLEILHDFAHAVHIEFLMPVVTRLRILFRCLRSELSTFVLDLEAIQILGLCSAH